MRIAVDLFFSNERFHFFHFLKFVFVPDRFLIGGTLMLKEVKANIARHFFKRKFWYTCRYKGKVRCFVLHFRDGL